MIARFTIGEWLKDFGHCSNDEYEQLKQEIKDKLGVPDGYLGGSPAKRVINKDGLFYLADYWTIKDDQFDNGWDRIYTLLDRQRNKINTIDVLCECGNDTFTISYGSYECFGKCTQCNLRLSFYSG